MSPLRFQAIHNLALPMSTKNRSPLVWHPSRTQLTKGISAALHTGVPAAPDVTGLGGHLWVTVAHTRKLTENTDSASCVGVGERLSDEHSARVLQEQAAKIRHAALLAQGDIVLSKEENS